MIEVPKLDEPMMFWRVFPRTFGTPYQRMVYTEEQFDQLLKVFNGTDICFTSHNSYEGIDREETPNTTIVSKIFEDLDCLDKPENALLDARNLTRWALKNDLPFANAFSGSKGFHFYLLLKPEKYQINASLCNAIYSVQKWLCDKKQAGTRHHDIKIWGDVKRLCRIWYTRYVTIKDGKPFRKDTYCCPLTPTMILGMNMDEIIEYSKNPKHIEFKDNFSGHYLKLHEFVKKFNIDIHKINSDKSRGYVKEDQILEYNKPDNQYIMELFPDMCIHSQLISDNPLHAARFCGVITLKKIGLNKEKIFDLFMSLNWIDSHKVGTMRYQIGHIFDHVPMYNHPTCAWRKIKGICVGKKCPKYWED